MFSKILDKIKEIFRPETIYDNVEAYIVAGNPQTSADVDRLERGFYERHRRHIWWNLEN